MSAWFRLIVASAFALCSGLAASAVWGLPPSLLDKPWVNSDGAVVQLRGMGTPVPTYTVVSMAYANCRKVCASTTLVMQQIDQLLRQKGIEANFVILGYDPKNDRPADWLKFRQARSLTDPHWWFLSGDDPTVAEASRYLELPFWEYHGHIVHDFKVVVFDASWHAAAEVDWAHMADLPMALSAIHNMR